MRSVFPIVAALIFSLPCLAKTNPEGPLLVVTKLSRPAKGAGQVDGQCLIFGDRILKKNRVEFLDVTRSETISYAPYELIRRIDQAVKGKLGAITNSRFNQPHRDEDWRIEAVAEDPKEPGADERFLLLSSVEGKQNEAPEAAELIAVGAKLCELGSL